MSATSETKLSTCIADRIATGRRGRGSMGEGSSAATSRWTERRTRHRGARDDLRKFKTMKTDKFDEFDEWIDGDQSMRYSPQDADARKHLSGWAMRNTNNHNKKVLKKSCLGVFLCNKSCRTHSGDATSVRPATSDKARQKQCGKACPNPHCDGRLYHVACTGKGGYPATHFWRVTDQVILFQCKGVHDHPRPDVVKTTTAAKQALLDYHRRHRHERPKEICKKVGVYIHKSFSRVDRVARQLREVASEQQGKLHEHLGSEDRKTPDSHQPFPLRASYHDLWASPQKASDAAGKHAAVPSMSASYYQHHQPDMYASLPLHETYSTYGNYNTNNSHSAYSSYNQAMSSDYDHNMASGYSSQSSIPTMSSYLEVKPETNCYSYQPLKHSPRQASVPACSPNQELSHQVHGSTQYCTDYHSDGSSTTSDATPVKSTFKRKGAPDLIPIESKQVKFQKDEDPVEMNPIKLSEHTPGINLDLSNFADIFDFSGLTQDEGLGLAGRPKSATLVSSESNGNSKTTVQNTKIEVEVHDDKHSESTESLLCVSSPAVDTTTPVSSASNSPGQPDHQASTPMSKLQSYPPCSNTTTTLTTLDTHNSSDSSHSTHYQPAAPGSQSLVTSTSSGQPDEESEGYINFLVRMYLGKDERQISTLKSEFTVYTADLQKAYSNRNHGEAGQHHSYKSHNGQYEFSWYNTDTHRSTPHHNTVSPLNVSARFEYPLTHSSYMGTRHERPAYQ